METAKCPSSMESMVFFRVEVETREEETKKKDADVTIWYTSTEIPRM
jgi:hypothetical protein